MNGIKQKALYSMVFVLFFAVLNVAVGCGGGEGQSEFDCSSHDQCLDHEACLGEVCVDAPEAGDACPDEYDGERFEDLICEDGSWTSFALADLAVIIDPPAAVDAGDAFEVAVELIDDEGEGVHVEGVDVTLELNRHQFSTGDDRVTESTDESGVAGFELVIDEVDTDYVLTATSKEEELAGVSVQTEPFDVLSTSPNELTIVTEPPGEVTAGEAFEVAVELPDTVDDRDGVEVELALNKGVFSTGEAEAVEVTDGSGVSEFELVIDEADAGLVLTATSDDLDIDVGSTHSTAFDVVADDASPQMSSIDGQERVVADGQEVAEITIELRDPFGNPVVGVTPEFSATGEGNDYEDCTETDDDGIAICGMTSTEWGEKTLEIVEPVAMTGEVIEFLPQCNEDGSPFGGGDGTAGDPSRICTAAHLQAIADGTSSLGNDFVLLADIDLSDIDDFDVIGHGEDIDRVFSGSFDGKGFVIEQLIIDEPDDRYVGLFGLISEEGSVENLVLKNIEITGDRHVGPLFGILHGHVKDVTIENVEVVGLNRHAGGLGGQVGSGTIEGVEVIGEGSVNGNEYVGGLVGRTGNESDIRESTATIDVSGTDHRVGGFVGRNRGTIEDCHATGDVAGEASNVGGFVGENSGEPGLIHRSSATGDVAGEGSTSEHIGGFVGRNGRIHGPTGVITESYATGNVLSHYRAAGGFAGLNINLFDEDDESQIHRSYATGRVELGGRRGGGFVGWNTGLITESYSTGEVVDDGEVVNIGGFAGRTFGRISMSYWDMETSEMDEGIGRIDDDENLTVIGLETGAFENEASFDEAWDFDDVWVIDEAPDGEPRPVLQWQDE